ncbi:MAG: lipid-A-disaccharide synthase [Phycisphaerales bacterium]|nr:lipid-A-disaccharide synthase [Phycisphaerales bacterium]
MVALSDSTALAPAVISELLSMDASNSRTERTVLFTAFEPSGDAHAAGVIAALKELDPSLNIVALGGRRMEAAGAQLLERTADDGAMGINVFKRALEVRAAHQSIKRWAQQHRVWVHVPVDSPAANFSLAQHFRQRGARVVHLVAPQLWAWGERRAAKLRACTDLVLCLLPFEEAWFRERQIPAKFIGHPTFEREFDPARMKSEGANLPKGSPKILLLPGSRSSEVRANIKLLVHSFADLQGRFRGTVGLIGCSSEDNAKLVRRLCREVPTGLHIGVVPIDIAVFWCDLALAVSGTVTLDVAKHAKPMVGVYRTGPLSAWGARLVLRSPFRLLPNIVARREIVPEFVPYFGGPGPIVEAAALYLTDSRNMARAQADLKRIAVLFQGHAPSKEAAQAIAEIARKAGTGEYIQHHSQGANS